MEGLSGAPATELKASRGHPNAPKKAPGTAGARARILLLPCGFVCSRPTQWHSCLFSRQAHVFVQRSHAGPRNCMKQKDFRDGWGRSRAVSARPGTAESDSQRHLQRHALVVGTPNDQRCGRTLRRNNFIENSRFTLKNVSFTQ